MGIGNPNQPTGSGCGESRFFSQLAPGLKLLATQGEGTAQWCQSFVKKTDVGRWLLGFMCDLYVYIYIYTYTYIYIYIYMHVYIYIYYICMILQGGETLHGSRSLVRSWCHCSKFAWLMTSGLHRRYFVPLLREVAEGIPTSQCWDSFFFFYFETVISVPAIFRELGTFQWTFQFCVGMLRIFYCSTCCFPRFLLVKTYNLILRRSGWSRRRSGV